MSVPTPWLPASPLPGRRAFPRRPTARPRRPNAALRRAARERDKCRCRFPGCESRRVDLHHIQYWSNGGRTSLDNLISLCKYHHMLVHDRGHLIAAARDGTFTFYRPDGTAIPASPPLPQPDGAIEDCHDADITPETIIPPWYGERLDLDHAVYVCFANATNIRCAPDRPPAWRADRRLRACALRSHAGGSCSQASSKAVVTLVYPARRRLPPLTPSCFPAAPELTRSLMADILPSGTDNGLGAERACCS